MGTATATKGPSNWKGNVQLFHLVMTISMNANYLQLYRKYFLLNVESDFSSERHNYISSYSHGKVGKREGLNLLCLISLLILNLNQINPWK